MKINISRFSFVAFALFAVTLGASAGKCKFNEFTIKKTSDKASPLMLRDLTIPAGANCVIAAVSYGANAHVKVFSGRMSQGTMQVLMGDGSVRSIQVQVGAPPMAPSSSQNNLKQMTLASIRFDELRIALIRAMGDGSVKEYKTVRLRGARMRDVERTAAGRPAPEGSALITYSGLEAASYIGAANGGIWKTTNF